MKISDLPEITDPDGTETVVALKDGEARRVGLGAATVAVTTEALGLIETARNEALEAINDTIGTDLSATAADRVATGNDRIATAADRVATGNDKTATAADRVATGNDRTATAADRVQTGLDRTATALLAAQSGLAVLWSAIGGGAALAPATAQLRTAGYAAVADGGDAVFAPVLSGSPYAISFTDATSGQVFEMQPDRGRFKAESFGASRTALATANATALQRAANHAVYLQRAGPGAHTIDLGMGSMQIDSPIIWADTSGGAFLYHVAAITGQHEGYNGARGSQLVASGADMRDLPMLVSAKGRNFEVSKLALGGPADTNPLPTYQQLLIGRKAGTPWYMSVPLRTNAYSPQCAISIDPFSSATAVGDRYTALNAWYAYSGGTSRGASVRRVQMSGHYTCIALSTGSGNLLDDDVDIGDCGFFRSAVGIAAPNDQTRGLIISKPDIYGLDTFFDGVRPALSGKGASANVTGGVGTHCRHIAVVQPNWNPFSWTQGYFESVWSLGYFLGGAAVSSFAGIYKLIDGNQNNLPNPDCNLHAGAPVVLTGGYFGKYLGKARPLVFFNSVRVMLRDCSIDCPVVATDMSLIEYDNVTLRYVTTGGLPVGRPIRQTLATVGAYDIPAVTNTTVLEVSSIGNTYYHYIPLNNYFNNIIETATLTVDSTTGTATFTAANPDLYIARGDGGSSYDGDVVSIGFQGIGTQWYGEMHDDTTVVNYSGTAACSVIAKSGSTITLANVPVSLRSGSYPICEKRVPLIRARCIGQTANASAVITGVSASTFKLRDRIRGPNIPSFARVIAISGTAPNITLTLNVTCAGNGIVELYDAQMRLADAWTDGQTPAVGIKGDFIRLRTGADVATNNVLRGYLCTQSGGSGFIQAAVWSPIYDQIVVTT